MENMESADSKDSKELSDTEKREIVHWLLRVLFAICVFVLYEVAEIAYARNGTHYKQDKCEVVFNDNQSVVVDYSYSWSVADKKKRNRLIPTDMDEYSKIDGIIRESMYSALASTVTKDSSFEEVERTVKEKSNAVSDMIDVRVESVKVNSMEFKDSKNK